MAFVLAYALQCLIKRGCHSISPSATPPAAGRKLIAVSGAAEAEEGAAAAEESAALGPSMPAMASHQAVTLPQEAAARERHAYPTRLSCRTLAAAADAAAAARGVGGCGGSGTGVSDIDAGAGSSDGGGSSGSSDGSSGSSDGSSGSASGIGSGDGSGSGGLSPASSIGARRRCKRCAHGDSPARRELPYRAAKAGRFGPLDASKSVPAAMPPESTEQPARPRGQRTRTRARGGDCERPSRPLAPERIVMGDAKCYRLEDAAAASTSGRVTGAKRHPMEVTDAALRQALLQAVGLWGHVRAGAVVVLLDLQRDVEPALAAGDPEAKPRGLEGVELDLTGEDFVVLGRLRPDRAGEPQRVAPLAVCRQAGGGAAKCAATAALFVRASAGGAFHTQRRSPRKTAPGASMLQTSGLTWAASTPTSAPGLYAHLLDEQRGAQRRALLADVLRNVNQLLSSLFPDHMRLLRKHSRGLEPLGKGAGPFCTVSLTRNYHNKIHLDQSDPRLSYITWWLTGCGRLRGGAFRLVTAAIRFTPLQGTALMFNSHMLYHGTEPCTVLEGDIQRLGSALWVRESVVLAWRAWLAGARGRLLRSTGAARCSDAQADEYGRRVLQETPRCKRARVRRVIISEGRPSVAGTFDAAAARPACGCWGVAALPKGVELDL